MPTNMAVSICKPAFRHRLANDATPHSVGSSSNLSGMVLKCATRDIASGTMCGEGQAAVKSVENKTRLPKRQEIAESLTATPTNLQWVAQMRLKCPALKPGDVGLASRPHFQFTVAPIGRWYRRTEAGISQRCGHQFARTESGAQKISRSSLGRITHILLPSSRAVGRQKSTAARKLLKGTMADKKSYQMGASHERQAYKAHLKRSIAKMNNDNWREIITGEVDWIDGRTKRFNARPGGLGRKPKAANSTAGKIKCAFGCKVPSV